MDHFIQASAWVDAVHLRPHPTTHLLRALDNGVNNSLAYNKLDLHATTVCVD